MSAPLFTDDEQGTLLIPSNIESMMAGVSTVFVIHPRYRLNYEDGTREDAICNELQPGAGFFTIVSAVQSKR